MKNLFLLIFFILPLTAFPLTEEEDSFARLILAKSYYLKGEYCAARAVLNSLIGQANPLRSRGEIGQELVESYFYLGEIAYACGDFSAAQGYYCRALEDNKDINFGDLIYQRLSLVYLDSNQVSEAKSNIARILNDELRSLSQGVYAFKVKDYVSALKLFGDFLEKFAQSKYRLNVYLNKAETFYEMGRIDDAFFLYKDILSEFKNMEDKNILNKVQYGLACCYLKKGKVNDSLLIYGQILENNSGNVYADYSRLQRGIIFLKTKEFDKALTELIAVRGRFSNAKLMPQIEYYLAMVYFSQQKYDQALDTLFSFVKNFPQDDLMGKVYYLYSQCFLKKQDYPRALNYLEKIIAEVKDKEIIKAAEYDIGHIKLRLARQASADGRVDKAVSLYDEVIESDKNLSKQALLDKAFLFKEKKDYVQAVICFEQAAQFVNISARAIFSYAFCLERVGRIQDATARYWEIIHVKDEQDNMEYKLKAYFRLARLYEKQGRRQEAGDIYNQVAALDVEESKIAAARLAEFE